MCHEDQCYRHAARVGLADGGGCICSRLRGRAATRRWPQRWTAAASDRGLCRADVQRCLLFRGRSARDYRNLPAERRPLGLRTRPGSARRTRGHQRRCCGWPEHASSSAAGGGRGMRRSERWCSLLGCDIAWRHRRSMLRRRRYARLHSVRSSAPTSRTLLVSERCRMHQRSALAQRWCGPGPKSKGSR